MKINYVHIKNFRSIKDIKLTFDPKCRILVGINESGKSNILNALSFLDTTKTPKRLEDDRECLPEEPSSKESHIRFFFDLDQEENNQIINSLSKRILINDNRNAIKQSGVDISFKQFFLNRLKKIFLEINIITEESRVRYYAFDNCNLNRKWKKPKKGIDENTSFIFKGKDYKLSEFSLIEDSADLEKHAIDLLEDSNIKDLDSLIINAGRKLIEEHLPKVVFWRYEEKNLLPSKINIQAFADNPSICVPLKNMFILGGEEENSISDQLTSLLKNERGNKLQNYLNSIAKKTTQHFRSIWKQSNEKVEFSLRLNGDCINPGIVGKGGNAFDFKSRSDGFKRFITFLLIISIEVKSGSIKNSLILIDEAEMGLHPSGCRYLAKELIRISDNNYVVYSTHSPFMIDCEDAKRHYLVKKEKDITSIEEVAESRFKDEEVIYNAIGYSTFEVLKKDNIVFEGYRDKILFNKALTGCNQNLKEKYKNLACTHSFGVKSIEGIVPILELAKRKCVIVSDQDKIALDYKKKHKDNKNYGDWYTYKDIDTSIKAKTGEDFLKDKFILEQIKKTLNISISNFALPEVDKLKSIKEFLKNQKIKDTDDQNQKIKDTDDQYQKIKNMLFENLTYNDINIEEYKKILDKLHTLFDSAT